MKAETRLVPESEHKLQPILYGTGAPLFTHVYGVLFEGAGMETFVTVYSREPNFVPPITKPMLRRAIRRYVKNGRELPRQTA